jgi:hypothetical protein
MIVTRGRALVQPLIGVESLKLTTPVLLVEGAAALKSAQFYFPERPCITWEGAEHGVLTTDWAPLKGRVVTLYPRNDDLGVTTMHAVAHELWALGCALRIVDPVGCPLEYDLSNFQKIGQSREDVIGYLKGHTEPLVPAIPPVDRTEKPPEPIKPATVTQIPTKVQKSPPRGSQTLEQGAKPGSLSETYQKHGFLLKATGAAYCNQFNVGRGIKARGDEVYYDQFTQKIMAGGVEWSDQLNLALTDALQCTLGLHDMKPHVVYDGVQAYAFAHQRHPLKEWLTGLEWDGHARLAELLPIGFGAADNDYTQAVGRCFMVGMVARVLNPGCQLDTMPVFEGNQGVGKTSGLRIIGGDYFAEVHESFASKDFYLSITGKMLCEISELSAFKRSEIVLINGVLTSVVDRYRAPYGRVAADHPRSCVFAGTTNHDDWITDETGARRFWPVRCGEINREWLHVERDQYFAEAVSRFQDGEDWWQVPASVEAQRAARRDTDPWEELMRPYLEANKEVRISYIIGSILELKASQMEMLTQKRVAKILRQNGYEKRVRRDTTNALLKVWAKD